jgi:hypothetical protein
MFRSGSLAAHRSIREVFGTVNNTLPDTTLKSRGIPTMSFDKARNSVIAVSVMSVPYKYLRGIEPTPRRIEVLAPPLKLPTNLEKSGVSPIDFVIYSFAFEYTSKAHIGK